MCILWIYQAVMKDLKYMMTAICISDFGYMLISICLLYTSPHTYKWDGEQADYTPASDDIPWCLKPEKKVTIEDVKYVLSAHFQGTPYDPYGSYGEKSMKGAFRSIGVNRNDFLSVIEMRPEQADITENTGNIIQWVAFASNVFNVLVPFYGEVETTPEYVLSLIHL